MKHTDLRVANDNVRVTAIFGPFGLDVAEGARDRQPSGEYTQGSLNIKVFFIGARGSLRESLSAVNLTSSSLDALPFQLTVGLVVSADHSSLTARVQTHNASAVTNVNDVGGIVNYYNTDRAAARTLGSHDLTRILLLGSSLSELHQLDVGLLTIFEARCDRRFRLLGEFFVLNNKVVQVVSKVVRAHRASMSIEHAKEAHPGPLHASRNLLLLWLRDVNHD